MGWAVFRLASSDYRAPIVEMLNARRIAIRHHPKTIIDASPDHVIGNGNSQSGSTDAAPNRVAVPRSMW